MAIRCHAAANFKREQLIVGVGGEGHVRHLEARWWRASEDQMRDTRVGLGAIHLLVVAIHSVAAGQVERFKVATACAEAVAPRCGVHGARHSAHGAGCMVQGAGYGRWAPRMPQAVGACCTADNQDGGGWGACAGHGRPSAPRLPEIMMPSMADDAEAKVAAKRVPDETSPSSRQMPLVFRPTVPPSIVLHVE